ncbi:MAG TPA: hypothetical protein PLC82_13985 [Smithellaceae bacterium]|nr:hypothetical protein [Smithellaceae bacterium]
MANHAGGFIGVYLGYYLEKTMGKAGVEIVARGTAIFFGLCACAFLPMYVGGLWFRSITKAGAIAGMICGATTCFLWMLLIHETTSRALLFCNAVFGRTSLALIDGKPLVWGPFVWPYVDPLIIGLPIAIIITIAVSCFTPKMPEKHLLMCLGKPKY